MFGGDQVWRLSSKSPCGNRVTKCAAQSTRKLGKAQPHASQCRKLALTWASRRLGKFIIWPFQKMPIRVGVLGARSTPLGAP